MSDTEEWTREDDQHIATWIARNPNTALASGVRRAVTELWKTQGRLTDLAATVAALTAENERLRETVTLGLGEQESVIVGLRTENERLISEITTACDTAMRLDIPTRELVGRLRAALPSSRETTDG